MSMISPTPLGSVAGKAINWSIALSILLILAGFFAILIPSVSGIAITLFIGWTIIISGNRSTNTVMAFKTLSIGGLLWELLFGALYLFAGGYLVFHPLSGLLSLTLLLAAYLFISGIIEIIHAFQVRPRHGTAWLWINAAITLILAIMIWHSWPASSIWAIGTLGWPRHDLQRLLPPHALAGRQTRPRRLKTCPAGRASCAEGGRSHAFLTCLGKVKELHRPSRWSGSWLPTIGRPHPKGAYTSAK